MLSVKQDEPGYFNIQTLARKTGITRRTIRYYVQRGLIPRPEGGGRGHYYTKDHLDSIKKIQQLSSQGVPLEAIKRLVSGGGIAEAARQEPAAPSYSEPAESTFPMSHKSQWIRINLGTDVELSFKKDALSDDDQKAIVEFINTRIKDRK